MCASISDWLCGTGECSRMFAPQVVHMPCAHTESMTIIIVHVRISHSTTTKQRCFCCRLMQRTDDVNVSAGRTLSIFTYEIYWFFRWAQLCAAVRMYNFRRCSCTKSRRGRRHMNWCTCANTLVNVVVVVIAVVFFSCIHIWTSLCWSFLDLVFILDIQRCRLWMRRSLTDVYVDYAAVKTNEWVCLSICV